MALNYKIIDYDMLNIKQTQIYNYVIQNIHLSLYLMIIRVADNTWKAGAKNHTEGSEGNFLQDVLRHIKLI